MSGALALVRASWRSALSYRLRTVLSLLGLLSTVVPVYFVANALQPTMAEAIRGEGGQYFSFLVVGLISFSFLQPAVKSLPGAINSGVRTGVLEALFATPARLPDILAGMTGYTFLWTALRSALFLLAAWILGAELVGSRLLVATLILLLIVVAHLPFGILAGASVLAFRTAGPFATIVLGVSALLGGVYYPTHVIPSWLEEVSAFLPLTYGLRALRRTLLDGASLGAVGTDLAILAGFAALLLVGSAAVFVRALRYAKRAGSLAQY